MHFVRMEWLCDAFQSCPKISGSFFCYPEVFFLLILMVRILCGAALGLGCAFAALAWVRELFRKRELEYDLTHKAEWLTALAAAVLGGACAGVTAEIPAAVCGVLLLLVCVTVAVADWKHRIIPNPAVIAVFVLKLAFGIPALCGVPGFPEFKIWQSLIGLAVCTVLFLLPGLFGKKVGAGDVKLAAAAGFFLGIYGALLAVVIMGVSVLLFSIAQRRVPVLAFLRSFIPMGPFIAFGLFAAYAAAPYVFII